MKLLTLNLKNFMGIKNLSLDLQGKNADIYGDNATGKTTVFNAVLWLLFDKNAENKKDFGIKTRVKGVEMSKMEHEVEALFDINSKTVKLRKVYHEIWSKPKGKLTAEFKGHTSDFYVNEEPYKAGEYKNYIASICDEEIFKLVTNPLYFNESSPWQARRKLVLSIAGDIVDADVIDSKKELAGLKEILGDSNVDSLIKIAKSKKAAIKKEIDELPVRISEVRNSIPADVPENTMELENNIHYAKDALATVDAQISKVMAESDTVGKAEDILNLKNQIVDEKAKSNDIYMAAKNSLDGKIRELEEPINELKDRKSEAERKIALCEESIKHCDLFRVELVNDFKATKDSVFKGFEVETVCPTCGQELPTDAIESTKARLDQQKEEFNLNKAQELTAINEQGKANNAKKEASQKYMASLNESIKGINDELAKHLKAVTEIRANLVEVKPDYSAVQKLEAKLAELEKPDTDSIATKKARLEPLQIQKEVQEGKLTGYQKQLASFEAAENARNRIIELEAKESVLAEQYEEYDRQIFLCESFTRQKVSLLESKINAKFRMANFTLFKENVTNDGIEECCETTFEGVPYTDLNNAARINVGLDIIKTLTEHYKFDAPIFVDNAEAVTRLIDMGDIQVIRLVVSEKDKSLRLSVNQEAKAGVA